MNAFFQKGDRSVWAFPKDSRIGFDLGTANVAIGNYFKNKTVNVYIEGVSVASKNGIAKGRSTKYILSQ